MKLPAFEYACPATLAEAVALLASGAGDAKLLAGGQSLVPMMAFRVASPSLLIDLRKLPELRRIEITDAGVRLGAMARWRDIEDDWCPGDGIDRDLYHGGELNDSLKNLESYGLYLRGYDPTTGDVHDEPDETAKPRRSRACSNASPST